MFLIRRKQMDMLEENEILKFENRMLGHLRTAFPASSTLFDDNTLRALIRLGITKAEQYGIVMEWDVRRFIECRMLYGTRFYEDSQTGPIGEVLRDETLGGREKMDKIEQLDLK